MIHAVQKMAYRLLRRNLVTRMRRQGFSWAKINTVLKACGQQPVIVVTTELQGGIKYNRIRFATPEKDTATRTPTIKQK